MRYVSAIPVGEQYEGMVILPNSEVFKTSTLHRVHPDDIFDR